MRYFLKDHINKNKNVELIIILILKSLIMEDRGNIPCQIVNLLKLYVMVK